MMSTGMMVALCVWYALIVLASVTIDRPPNWPRALYFVGAIVISVAVIWMGVRKDG